MGELYEIEVHQVNLNKCYQAQIEIGLKLKRHKAFIGLIQEPYCYKNKRVIIQGRMNKIAFDDKPRAMIISSVNNNISKVSHLCTRDVAVGLTKMAGRNVLMVSAYMDILSPMITEDLKNIIKYADRRRFPLLIGMDANAHNKIWGSKSDNKRGRELSEFILENSLKLENIGNKNTFECATGASIIDITLSRNLPIPISKWRVSTKDNHSDHHTIRYAIKDSIIKLPPHRPWEKANWGVFKEELNTYSITTPESMNSEDVEILVEDIYFNINTALDKACPFVPASTVTASNPWYTKGLMDKRKEVSALYKKYINNKCDENWQLYKSRLKRYKKHCSKVQNKYKQKYKQTLQTPKETADYINKLTKQSPPDIGTIKKDDGQYTLPGEETQEELANIHFPGHDPEKEITPNNTKISTKEIKNSSTDWIQQVKIKQAFDDFKAKKSAGPDGLKPTVLKHLTDRMIEAIELAYKASIKLHYTPTLWTHARVVFIPKPGKTDYTNPKAFRPISLSNYLIKGLEKLCRWKMNEMLEHHPINDNQHGFRAGYSTETAISETVNKIEKHIMEGEYCLGVFLDIQSAFDTIKPEYIAKSLDKHGAPEDLSAWYKNYLTYRRITIEGKNSSYSTVVEEGVQQGGVCSASFWTIAYNRAVEIVNSRGVTGIVYADDSCTLNGGKDLEQIFRKVGLVLRQLSAWGKTCGLKFNPAKTEAVLFSRDNPNKRRIKIPKLMMDGKEIKLKESVKYLGVTLDRRLFWTEHINNKITECKQIMMKVFADLRGTFGPKPKLIKWAYEGIVRPKMTYACLAWGHEIVTKQTKLKLKGLDRLAIRSMASTTKTSPQAAMELIVGLMPLELHIQQIGLNARERLHSKLKPAWISNSKNTTHNTPHLKYWDDLASELELGGATTDWCDEIIWDKGYTVNIDSLDGLSKHRKHSEYTIYTDGSKMQDKVGAGYVIYHKREVIYYESLKLNDTATVFQAEVTAIAQAAKQMIKLDRAKFVKILSDSQAALQALKGIKVHSKCVFEAMEALEMLRATGCSVRLAWIKAHIGLEGNELADAAAKAGAEDEMGINRYVHIRRPVCDRKADIKSAIWNRWEKRWIDDPQYTHTKHFLSRPNEGISKQILMHSKSTLSRLIQIITGHNYLSKHQNKMDATINPMCRLCEEVPETFHHFITECPALAIKRREFFLGKIFKMDLWKPKTILNFSQLEPINSWLTDMDHLLEEPIYELDVNYSITDSDSDV